MFVAQTKRFFTFPRFFFASFAVAKQSENCLDHVDEVFEDSRKSLLRISPDFDPNLRAVNFTVRIASARNVIIRSPPHPTLKTRNVETFVKHDVISYVCGS